MGKNGSGRRSPWNLFAERQVHMRSGDESRYVVLSRSLQIGVAAGFLLLLGLLAIASYSAIVRHFELAAQRQTLQDEVAAAVAQAERSAGELASLRQRSESAEREIERLRAALERAEAERMEALTASSEAGARAAELEAALLATTQERRRRAAELPETPEDHGRPPTGSAEIEELRAEVTGLRAELERVSREALALRRTADEARQALRDLQSDEAPQAPPQILPDPRNLPPLTATPAGEVLRLQQDLAAAQATVATLSADLEALKGDGSGAGPATAAAAELATLEEQLDSAHRRAQQLGGSLAAPQPEPPRDAPSDAAASPAPLPSPPASR